MKINKIEPQGYCGGVVRALKIMDKTLADSSWLYIGCFNLNSFLKFVVLISLL